MFWSLVFTLLANPLAHATPSADISTSHALPTLQVSDPQLDTQGFNTLFIEDRTLALTVDEANQQALSAPQVPGRIVAGFFKARYWLGVLLANDSDDAVQRVVSLDDWYHSSVDFYLQTHEGWQHTVTGQDHLPPNPMGNASLPHVIVTLPPHSQQMLWTSVQTSISLWSSGLQVQTTDAFDASHQRHLIWLSLYYGVIAAMTLYNLCLWLILRQRLYAHYVAYALSLGVYTLTYTGYIDHFIDLPSHLIFELASAGAALFTAFFVLFGAELLQTHRHFPRLHRYLRTASGVLPALGALSFLDLQWLVITKGFVITLAPVMLLTALMGWRKGVPFSGLFLIIYGSFLTGLTFHATTNFGLTPFTPLTRYSYLAGSLAELLGLSILLALRIKSIQQALSQQQQTEQLRLQDEVNRRTQALNKALTSAENAMQARATFLATMSHEIRTPIYGILGLLRIALKGHTEPNQRQLLEKSQRSAAGLLDVINDILDFSQIDAAKLHLAPRPFRIPPLMQAVHDVLSASASEKGIQFTTWVSPQCPEGVVGDQARLRQVLVNLAGNAVKFTPSGGQVLLRVTLAASTPTHAHLQFEVIDTGIGISDDALHHLFSPFTQADTGIQRQFGGAGLGLSICKSLVNLMGGDIAVTSTLGQGSTFTFTLPLVAVNQEDLPPEPTDTGHDLPRLSQHGIRMLLVEDNPINCVFRRT